jgi:ribosomal protein S1
VVPFGAFVDLGSGVQGLIHVSEMGWSRVADTSQVVAPGEPVTVKVLRIEDAGKKIALGMKQLLDDPWSAVQSTYQVGQTVPGRVTRLAEFGAFVELEPGIEGLAHASTFAPRGSERWTRSVAVGMTGPFEILSIDPDKKRIGVALVQEGSPRNLARAAAREAADEAAHVREYTEGQKASAEGFGSLADRLRGALDPQRRR